MYIIEEYSNRNALSGPWTEEEVQKIMRILGAKGTTTCGTWYVKGRVFQVRILDGRSMFFPIDEEETTPTEKIEVLSSHGRFKYRIKTWKRNKPKTWWLGHTFWWLLHNCVSHNLIGFIPLKVFFNFHDYTSRKINYEK